MLHYRTLQGDTWDLIAARMYPQNGKESMTSILIEYNHDYADIVIFPAGIVLNVPEISKSTPDTLPPWK